MEGKKVLAAEDDAFAMKMFTTILTALGQHVDPATDGKDAVAKYKANPAAYKIIFMDLHMPNMDGYQVSTAFTLLNARIQGACFIPYFGFQNIQATAAIREHEKSNKIPHVKIIAMSAFEDDDTKAQTSNTGMDGIISKPVKPVELKKHL